MMQFEYNFLNEADDERKLFIEPWGEELVMKPKRHWQVASTHRLSDVAFHDEGTAIFFDSASAILIKDMNTGEVVLEWQPAG